MTSFRALAELGEELSATRSRIRLAELIAGFLSALAPEEVAPGTRLIIGRVFAEGDARSLNLSGSAVARVLGRVAGQGESLWDSAGDAVDFGEAVETVLDHAGHQPEGEPLGLLETVHTFEAIAGTRPAQAHVT